MTKRLLNQTLSALIEVTIGVVCIGAFAAAIPGSAHAAEREICDKMTGEQLRRCIEDSSRAPAPATSGVPNRPSNTSGTATGGAIILPPSPDKAVASTTPSTSGTLNCTKVTYTDQSFCIFRNSALLECANRAKYPDPGKCLNDVMSRSPELVAVDCKILPPAHQAACQQRNKVYGLCRNDKMNYLACLETKMAKK